MREAYDVRIRATHAMKPGKRHESHRRAGDVGRERSHERDDDHQAHTETPPRPYATNADHPKHSTHRQNDQSERGGSIRTDQSIITDNTTNATRTQTDDANETERRDAGENPSRRRRTGGEGAALRNQMIGRSEHRTCVGYGTMFTNGRRRARRG